MFFKKDKKKLKNDLKTNICALLIHAANIDEDYTLDEEKIIKQTLLKLGYKEKDLSITIEKAKVIEKNSNQILEFTKEVKNLPENDKIKIIEALWTIIYSNKEADMYEANLMRRLAGLLYVDSKTMGDIKERVKTKIYNDISCK